MNRLNFAKTKVTFIVLNSLLSLLAGSDLVPPWKSVRAYRRAGLRWRHNQIFSHVYTDMTYQNQINVFTFFLVLEGDLHVINTLWSTNQRFCFILDQTFVILDSVLQLLGKKIDMTANLKCQLSRNRIWQALKKYGAVNPEINQGKP